MSLDEIVARTKLPISVRIVREWDEDAYIGGYGHHFVVNGRVTEPAAEATKLYLTAVKELSA
jgi:hypothetical protein